VETIAVYWEPVIKTYGFQVKTGLALLRLRLSVEQAAEWSARIQEMESAGDDFLMIAGQTVDGGVLQLNLLFAQETAGSPRGGPVALSAGDINLSGQIESPVELICFHGPHYGDRYGIADAAFGVLVGHGIDILASGCTGASVYIVVPEHKALTAVGFLSAKFAAPHPDDGQI